MNVKRTITIGGIALLTLAGILSAQGTLSSPSFSSECTVNLVELDSHSSPGFQSLTAVGGIVSGQLTSTSFITILDGCAGPAGCPLTLCGDCNGDGRRTTTVTMVPSGYGQRVLLRSPMGLPFCPLGMGGITKINNK